MSTNNESRGSTADKRAELYRRLAQESEPVRRAELLIELTQTLPRPEPKQARAWAEEALALARDNNQPELAARALFVIAEANFNAGMFRDAEVAAQESLAIALQQGSVFIEHKATNILGLLARQAGKRDEALRWYQQSLTAAEKLNDPQARARVYANLGNLMRDRADLDKALDYQLQALRLSEELGDTRLMYVLHLNIGATYGDLGDWEKSVEYFYRALVESEKAGDRLGMAISYMNIAETYLKRGKPERAMQSSELAVQCAREANSPSELLRAMGLVGAASSQLGDYARARSIYDENIRTAQELKLSQELAMNLRRKAELLLLQNEPQEAIDLLESALTAVEPGIPPLTRANIEYTIARAYTLTGETAKAQSMFESALSILKTLGKNYELAQVCFDYGRFLVEQGKRNEGLAMVQDAARIFRRLEVINLSDAAERYLYRMNVEEDRRLSLLRSLSTLAAHSLPLSEFAPRCLDTLKEALGFSEGTFFVDEGVPVRFGAACSEEELAVCRKGELTVSDRALCLPLRLSGRNVGGIYLRWDDPERGRQNAEQGMVGSYYEIVANLLSVAMERNRAQPATPLPEPAVAEVSSVTVRPRYPGFVGDSRVMQEIYDTIEQVAPTNACVLIRGESGTGKELIARIIKQRSPRANEPFVTLNCAAIPDTLVESELFGIEKGVATGVTERRGKFEQAHRGTLFLDEIGDISPMLQAKLLRVLQEQTFERVGGRKPIEVDVRIIVATNRDLEQAIKEGKFREDLYYRLNVITITLPPLRERQEDIPLLVRYFIDKYNEEFQRRIRGVTPEVLNIFLRYPWPGNVRELLNAIERAVILCRTDLIQVSDLPPALRQSAAASQPIETITDVKELRRRSRQASETILEKNLILNALRENNWSASKAARQIGVSRSHFYRLLKEHNIQRETDSGT